MSQDISCCYFVGVLLLFVSHPEWIVPEIWDINLFNKRSRTGVVLQIVAILQCQVGSC